MRAIAALALVLLVSTGSRAAVVSVGDGTFDAAGWEVVFATFRSGGGALGGGAAQITQAPPDGYPAPSGRVELVLPPAPAPTEYSSTFAVILRKGFVYDPMTQGAIATFDYEEDARVLALAQLTGLAVRQGGELYFAQVEVFTSTNWTRLVRKAIVRTNFEHLTPAGIVQGEYPDLSDTGAPIEVGFLRANSTGDGGTGHSNATLIDNWLVRLNPPCTLDGECDDGDPCGSEACVANVCQSTALACDDGDGCTIDACAAGSCSHLPLDCDDADACTADSCTGAACVNAAISCDDGDVCTADQCIAGACVNTAVSTEALVEGKIDDLLTIARGTCAGEPLVQKFGKKLVKKLKKARAKLAAADAATRAALIEKLHEKSDKLLAAADTLLSAAIANGLVEAPCGAELKALLDSIRACAAAL